MNSSNNAQLKNTFPRVSGAFAIAAGTTVIIGWIVDLPLLKSLHPGLVSMKANTALAFVITGISLLLLSSHEEDRQKVIARFLASIVFLVGLLTILQYAFTWDAGIDQLLFHEPQGTIGTYSPGRMALNTAISFCLLGITIMTMKLNSRWSNVLAQFAPLVVAFFGLLVLLSYAYGLTGFIGIAVYTRMALHTAVTFVLLSIGLLYLQPDAGIMTVVRSQGLAGYMARRLILASLGIPVVLGWLVSHGKMIGLYDNQFSEALSATAYIGIFVSLVWIIAKSLIKLEAERLSAEQAGKRAEETLSESEEKFRTFFENSSSAMAIIERDTTISMVNKEYCKLGLYEEKDVVGTSWTKQIPLEDLDRLKEYNRKRLIDPKSVPDHYEFKFIRKDGTIRNSLMSVAIIPTNQKIVCSFTDITERKRAEEALRETNEYLENLFNYANAPIIVWDPSLVITRFNHAFENLSGYSSAEVTGKKIDVLFPKEQIDSSINLIKKAVSGERWETVEIDIQRKDGDSRIVLWNSANILDKDDKTVVATIAQGYDITVRKRAEKALESQHALLSALINSPSDIIIFSLDRNYCYTTFNGKHREEMMRVWNVEIELGMNLLDCMHNPELRELAKQSIDRAIKGETLSETQHQPEPDIYYEFSWNPIFQQKEITGVTVFIRDITEHKRAEEVLRKSEERYRSLFENMLNGFAYCQMLYEDGGSKDFIYLDVNKSFEALTGLKNVIGKKVSDVIPGIREADNSLLEIYGRVALTGKPETFEMFVESLNDWYSISVYSPQKEFFVAVFDVVTKQKRAEEKLRETNEYLENLFKYANAPIIVWDPSLVITRFNHAFENLSGYSTEEVTGKKIDVLFPKEQIDSSLKLIKRAVSGERWETVEIEIQRKDGDIRIVLWNSANILDKDGKTVVATIAQGHDITERNRAEEETRRLLESSEHSRQTLLNILEDQKRAEEEVVKLNTELELRVLQRTSQLELANKELEAFSYSVSHDLRAPLRHIGGYVELLGEKYKKELPEKGLHYLEVIIDSTRQMGVLIDDLLKFSRTGRVEMRESVVDMSRIVEEISEQIRTDNPQRDIKWAIAQLPPVHCDNAMMHLVWENLLSNAVKYTRTRKAARIEIGVRDEDKEFVFFVRDNGVGFDMQYSQKLFGVFQRLHSAAEFEGTGVGLANVHRIVARHGGRTWAEAELDKGATFYFSLPK
jgi:PAS domain S-box-containing protein